MSEEIAHLLQVVIDYRWGKNTKNSFDEVYEQIVSLGIAAVEPIINALRDRIEGLAPTAHNRHLRQKLETMDGTSILIRIGKPAIPLLLKYIHDDHHDVRSTVISSLTYLYLLGSDDLERTLQLALQDESANIRYVAVQALAGKGGRDSIQLAIECLTDDAKIYIPQADHNQFVRTAASKALTGRGLEALELIIATLYNSPDPMLKSRTAEWLIRQLLEEDKYDEQIANGLKVDHPASGEDLLNHSIEEVSIWAASQLADLPKEKTVLVLIKAMKSPDGLAREAALYRAYQLKDTRFVEPLLELLEKRDHAETVIDLLGAIGDPRAIPALIPLAKLTYDADLVASLPLNPTLAMNNMDNVWQALMAQALQTRATRALENIRWLNKL